MEHKDMKFSQAFDKLEDILEDSCESAAILAQAVRDGAVDFTGDPDSSDDPDYEGDPDLVRVIYTGTPTSEMQFTVITVD